MLLSAYPEMVDNLNIDKLMDAFMGVNPGGQAPNILLRGPSIIRAPNNSAVTCHEVGSALTTV